jgi:hypothetical protein
MRELKVCHFSPREANYIAFMLSESGSLHLDVEQNAPCWNWVGNIGKDGMNCHSTINREPAPRFTWSDECERYIR